MSNEINTTFNKIDLDGFNNIVKELQNNKQYIITALNEKGVAASIDDTFMELANKITQIKEKEIITLPAETSNDFANTFFNTMMKSQGYDEMYETVWANYCGENGYVGALMTSLNKGTNTSIVLTGADAYYIYEEDKFYTVDENKKLVTVINGISTNLGTQSHLWDVENPNIIRTVFYLYVDGSTADGSRENVHPSAFDYCCDSNIPNIQYKSNSGNVMHFHVSNPDTCNLKCNDGKTNNRCYYFYTNVENANAQWALYNNQNVLTYVNFEALKKLTNGVLLQTSRVKKLDFPNITEVTGGTLISGCNALENVDLSNLQSVIGGTLISGCNVLESIYFPNLTEVSNGVLINSCNALEEINISNASVVIGKSNSYIRVITACSKIKRVFLKDGVQCSYLEHPTGNTLILDSNIIPELYVYSKEIIDNSTTYPFAMPIKLIFPTLNKGRIWIGSGASYANQYTRYIYIHCNGSKSDEIYLGANHNTADYIINVEIREGARQIITIKTLTMDVDSIVNNIFKKLADNNFEDDGVTPAPAIKITIGSKNLAKLTDEEKAIATNKNYILA